MYDAPWTVQSIVILSVIAAFVLGIAIFVILKIRNNLKKSPAITELYENEAEYNQASEKAIQEDNFDKEYFEQVQKGEPFQLFLVLGGQQDCGLIRSYLASNNISSYIENENVNRLYGGGSAGVTGLFAIKLYILIKDYDKAYEALCEFTKTKNNQTEASGGQENIGLFFAPYPSNAEQKSMGITVLPKKSL